jgi:hypothetical protein
LHFTLANAPSFTLSIDQSTHFTFKFIVLKEDLSAESTIKILKALKEGKQPPLGPQNGRKTCEPLGGQTSLLEEPTGPGYALQASLK